MLIGGILALPLAFLAGVFTETWIPGRILPFKIGPEDFLFCFFSGGLSMALTPWMANISYFQPKIRINHRRAFLVVLFGLIIVSILYILGIRNYINVAISMALTSVVLCLIESRFWKVFFSGSTFLLIIYGIGIEIGFIIWPDLIHLWNLDYMSEILVGRVPLEEFIWAFFFGGTWPTIILFVTKGSVEEKR